MADPNLSSFIWSVADLLRGNYRQSKYGKVILPFTVLRRLDCVLEPTKARVLAEKAKREKAGLNPEPFLLKVSGQNFFNTSPLDMKTLMGDQMNIGENLNAYMQGFSPVVRDIFEHFDFHIQIARLQKDGLLYLVTEKFANIDLHPDVVPNTRMGAVFEELIRRFAELSNETAGEHFTPREVIRLMVNLLFIEDDESLSKPGVVRSLYDPTAGTGGMLSVAGEHLAAHNPQARLVMYGQELNAESYAICKADMLIKGQDITNIVFGNTLSAAVPAPSPLEDASSNLIDASGFWQKMRKSLGSKRKELSQAHIDDITQIFGRFEEVTRDGVPISRIFRNEDFGYRTITVERPQRDEAGKVVLSTKGKTRGKPVADADLRDTENVPLAEDVNDYFTREVLPHALDAWIDAEKTKVGYEIPFNRHFYVFKPPRPLAEIDADLEVVTDRILTMIGELSN